MPCFMIYLYPNLMHMACPRKESLRNRKQRVNIKNQESDRKPLSKDFLQGSIMGPRIFNFSLNNIVLFMKNSSSANYADDNVISHLNIACPILITCEPVWIQTILLTVQQHQVATLEIKPRPLGWEAMMLQLS